MKQQTVISLAGYMKAMEQKEKNIGYMCFATEERLAGYCDLLICDACMQSAEYFLLKFTQEGLTQHQYLHGFQEIQAWQQGKCYTQITYLQALGLLGDAVRQNYKYRSVRNITQENSVHLQRIWNDAYYNNQSNLQWMLSCQDEMTILQTYLCAVSNKDAVLIYDMTSEEEQDVQGRDVFAYQWSHELEDFIVFDFKVQERIVNRERGTHTFFLTMYGIFKKYKVLSVDVCLQMIREHGTLRVLQEDVLEARRIYSRC